MFVFADLMRQCIGLLAQHLLRCPDRFALGLCEQDGTRMALGIGSFSRN